MVDFFRPSHKSIAMYMYTQSHLHYRCDLKIANAKYTVLTPKQLGEGFSSVAGCMLAVNLI